MLEAYLAFGPGIVANWSNTLADTLTVLRHGVAAVGVRPRRFGQGYANGHRKVILTVPQAAQYLGLAPKTLRARSGPLPSRKGHKKWHTRKSPKNGVRKLLV